MSDKKKTAGANERPKVMSIGDLQSADDNSSDEGEKQTYYTGGEKSGTAVVGSGPKGSEGSEDNNGRQWDNLMKAIFAQAASNPADDSAKPSSSFSGEARTLSGKTLKGAASKPAPRQAAVTLIFWRDGFTINQGPLRLFDEPENIRLLARIESGDATARDLDIEGYELVDLRLARLHDQPFSESKRSQVTGTPTAAPLEKKMAGECKSLGADGDVPSIAINRAATEEPNGQARLQIRMPDGSRKVIVTRSAASLAELYTTIRSEYASLDPENVYNLYRTGLDDFELRTVAPVGLVPEIADANLSQAGLANSVLLVVMKK